MQYIEKDLFLRSRHCRPCTEEDEDNAQNEAEEEGAAAVPNRRTREEEEDLATVRSLGEEGNDSSEESAFVVQRRQMTCQLCPCWYTLIAPTAATQNRATVGRWGALWAIAKAPSTLALAATVPVVEPPPPPGQEQEEDGGVERGWSRFLTVLHCYLIPVFVVFAFGLSGYEVLEGVAAWQAALFFGQFAAVVLLLFSPGVDGGASFPWWHPALAYVGFCSGVAWIYLAAGEAVSVLKALGAASGASDAILGLTLLAWGNSVGDLAADVAVSSFSPVFLNSARSPSDHSVHTPGRSSWLPPHGLLGQPGRAPPEPPPGHGRPLPALPGPQRLGAPQGGPHPGRRRALRLRGDRPGGARGHVLALPVPRRARPGDDPRLGLRRLHGRSGGGGAGDAPLPTGGQEVLSM